MIKHNIQLKHYKTWKNIKRLLIFWSKAKSFLWKQFCWLGLNHTCNLWFPSVLISLVWNTNLKILWKQCESRILLGFNPNFLWLSFPRLVWQVFPPPFESLLLYDYQKYITHYINSKSTEKHSLDSEEPVITNLQDNHRLWFGICLLLDLFMC